MTYILNDQLFDFLQNFCPDVEVRYTETGIEIFDPENPDSVYEIAKNL